MAWIHKMVTRARVSPLNRTKLSPLGSQGSTKQHNVNNSTFLESIASLTPSQLDHAIMGMLNINPEEGSSLNKICQASPITRAGKRMQLIRVMGAVLLPVMALMNLVAYISVSKLNGYIADSKTRSNVQFGLELSNMIHRLQQERDRSALYVSIIGPETKASLVYAYGYVDISITNISQWPAQVQGNEFESQTSFQRFLNNHRYNLDVQPTSVEDELAFYNSLIDHLQIWLHTAATNTEANNAWPIIVAMLEIVNAKDNVGIERALGAVFFARGGFDSETYLRFVQAKDFAQASFDAANIYSPIVQDIYNVTLQQIEDNWTFISEMVDYIYSYDYRHDNLEPSLVKAESWYENISIYMDALLNIQDKLTDVIITTMDENTADVETTLAIVGLLFAITVLICPAIMHGMHVLTSRTQVFSLNLACRTNDLNREKRRTDRLLHKMLPPVVADQLKTSGEVEAESYTDITVYFSDIVGFTKLSQRSSPQQIVGLLQNLYNAFDNILRKYDVYKVETIGDAYMVASGLPKRNGKRHASEIATMALDIRSDMRYKEVPHLPGKRMMLRMGIHTGPAVAGVVGFKMPRYCLFGQTVTIASTMESTGEAGKIQISEVCYHALQELKTFSCSQRQVKRTKNRGKGIQPTYWLNGKTTDSGTMFNDDIKSFNSDDDYGDNELIAAIQDLSMSTVGYQDMEEDENAFVRRICFTDSSSTGSPVAGSSKPTFPAYETYLGL